jgi:hypothetical protein
VGASFWTRLCGTLPPPRRHLVRDAGVFGPAYRQRAKLRALVPLRTDKPSGTPAPGGSTGAVGSRGPSCCAGCSPPPPCWRAPCGGRRRVVVVVVVVSAIARTLLAARGLPCTPATVAPARAPPQAELWFDNAS